MDRVTEEVSSASLDPGQDQVRHQPYRLETKHAGTIWVADQTYIRRDPERNVFKYEGIIYDITEQQIAKEELKTLQGIIPICMYCKEIRDEEGLWTQLEEYISQRSSAEFSHAICEKCMQEKFTTD